MVVNAKYVKRNIAMLVAALLIQTMQISAKVSDFDTFIGKFRPIELDGNLHTDQIDNLTAINAFLSNDTISKEYVLKYIYRNRVEEYDSWEKRSSIHLSRYAYGCKVEYGKYIIALIFLRELDSEDIKADIHVYTKKGREVYNVCMGFFNWRAYTSFSFTTCFDKFVITESIIPYAFGYVPFVPTDEREWRNTRFYSTYALNENGELLSTGDGTAAPADVMPAAFYESLHLQYGNCYQKTRVKWVEVEY